MSKLNFLVVVLVILVKTLDMATPQTLQPTRTSLSDADIENLNQHCLYIAFTPTDAKDVGLDCRVVFDLYGEEYQDKLEGVLKLPQQQEVDEFLAVFTPSIFDLSQRIQLPIGSQEFSFEDGSSAKYIGTSKLLSEIKETSVETHKVLLRNLYSCLVSGAPKDISMFWVASPGFVRTSTPHKPDDLVQKLVGQITDTPTETIQQLLKALELETQKRGVSAPKPLGPSGPKPPKPTGSNAQHNQTVIDPNVLGETIAKANESLIETLAQHGLLRSQIPKISQFSGDNLKGDVSFEQWEYEVEILKATHTESAIREAITKSLKGSASEALRALGPLATLTEILVSFKGKYAIAASYDTLMSDLYTFTQQEDETVPQFATKIETKLSSIKWKFPGNVTTEVESRILRDRLFFGIKKDIRDSIRYRFSDPYVSYSDLLRFARESEVEHQAMNSPSESSKEKKGKVKTSSVTTSTVNPSSNPDVEKLTKAAEKVQKETEKAEALLKQMLDTFNRFNNPNTGSTGSRGRGNGNRGRGRGRGRGAPQGDNQETNQAQNQTQNQTSAQGYRRSPRCFHCIQHGADRVDHWPNQCQWLKSILQDWHSTQSDLGHQNQSQNLNN